MKQSSILLGIMALLVSGILFPLPSYAEGEKPQASFDCQKAGNSIEKIICSDSELAQSDKELGKLVDTFHDRLKNSFWDNFLQGQRNWLKLREKACVIDLAEISQDNKLECMKKVYAARLKDLNQRLKSWEITKKIDYDKVLDTKEKLTAYIPEDMSSMYQYVNNEFDFTKNYVPKTCREMHTLSAGLWDYSQDTIGHNSQSFIESTCAFMLLSNLSDIASSDKARSKLEHDFTKAIDSIQDEAEFHKIIKVKYGSFSHPNRDEVLAVIFSSDTGTLRFYKLYIGFYDKSQNFLFKPFEKNSFFPSLAND